MTDEQLQLAIDKTLAMAMSTEGGYKHDRFREDAHAHLKELFKIQAIRASFPSYPTLKAQSALDRKAENACELGLDYEPENTLHWHALNYRMASTQNAQAMFEALEKFVETKFKDNS